MSGAGSHTAGVVQVAAALLWRGGRFLICQRPACKSQGLLWEFVGGKLEPGETVAQALVRECREELGITVRPGTVFMQVTHTYPDITVHLTLLNAEIEQGEPRLLEHAAMAWIFPEEVDGYPFCPADAAILERLKAMARKV